MRRERARAPVAALGSQPWLLEAVGTAEWTGTPLAPILREAGLSPGGKEVVFTGLDRGIQGGVEHLYERSLPVDEALGDDVLLAYALNGEPLPPQHGYPLRLLVPGLVRDDAREVAEHDHGDRRGVPRLAASRRIPDSAVRGRRRERR